ncbi:hypothetical protein B0H16DRAFT_1450005 [Mycena metata]|uniref:Uncharacterized protein n=1 Tax=Mycena metata TaxID=1033252 RepID=A0AAD7K1X6_9AGAR|nr:hypothetical protein B0H16DRAFT_1450005 [Mycena metata]
MVSFILVAGVLLLTAVRAASQVASSSWRKPNITTLREERTRCKWSIPRWEFGSQKKDAAIPNFLGYPKPTPSQSRGTSTQLALFDLATNQTKYESALDHFMSNAVQTHILGRTGDGLAFGHATAKAYIAYKKQSFLEYAVQSWWRGRQFTLSAQDIAAQSQQGSLRWFNQWLLFKLYTLTALDRSHLSFLPLNLSDDSMNNGTSQSRRRRKRAQRDAERSMRDHDLARADARSRKSVEQTFAVSDWEESIAECKNLSPACRENPLWDLGGAEFSNHQAAAADGRISPDHRSVD